MEQMNQLLDIMKALRDSKRGCPWDLEQNFKTIAPYTIEEAYEVADAIEKNDMDALCGELGDLLFQVVYHAQLAEEENAFNFTDAAEKIIDKLITRHPHVFGDEDIPDAKSQSIAWEKIKREERLKANSEENKKIRLLDDINLSMPSLSRAQKLQGRAATVGFDWIDVQPVLGKIQEEFDEVKEEVDKKPKDTNRISEELGDLLFACVNLARHFEIDAESALRGANQKFEQRFGFIEDSLAQQGASLEEATLEEMDELWNKSKE